MRVIRTEIAEVLIIEAAGLHGCARVLSGELQPAHLP
jgi:hypothetical protein